MGLAGSRTARHSPARWILTINCCHKHIASGGEMTELGDDLLTVREVATYLRKSPSTVYRLTREGRLPAKKVGGTWRFSRKSLDEWLRDSFPNQPAIVEIST
jgi:excisionase family DNA binding protein